MKPYNEQEFNKLCAEFIGWKHYEGLNPSWNGSFETVQSDNYFFNRVYMKSELKFHSDCNWIHEVIEKIYYFKTLIISNNHCEVHFMIEDNMRINVHARTTKEAVVQAIWQFLNWYNEQQS